MTATAYYFCSWCGELAPLNNTAPATNDGYWCEACQVMTYPDLESEEL